MENLAEQFWNRKNVFVTGATGLLGSSLVKELLKRKVNVIALVRDQVHNSNFFRDGHHTKVTIVKGDLTDYRLLERVMNEHEVDTVFHLGAQTIVQTANRSPISTFESNIRGSWNIFEACRVNEMVKRVIVASSDKAYGDQEVLPYTEEAPLQGRHPYDASKTCTDTLALTYAKTYGLPVSVTRCGNLYGPGDLNWNRIIPDTIRYLHYNEAPVIRSDGQFIRDFFFIDDASDAYIRLAEQLHRPDIKGQAFNFSTMNKLTVLELVKKILALYPSNLEPVILNQVKGEIKNQYLSSEKAKRLLNWEPKHGLDEGLTRTIAWYKAFLQQYG